VRASEAWTVLFAVVAVVAISAAAAFHQQAEDWKDRWHRQGELVMELYGRQGVCPREAP